MHEKRSTLGRLRSSIQLARHRGGRTEANIFRELATLKGEKVRLQTEKRNWENKVRSIEARLVEIAAAEEVLEEEASRSGDPSGQRLLATRQDPAPRDGDTGDVHEMTVSY